MMTESVRSSRRSVIAVVLSVIALMLGGMVPASSHSTSEYVSVYPALRGTSYWAKTAGTEPARHHIIWSNFGVQNDWAVDIYAPPGRAIVSPFGSKTSNGQGTSVRVLSVAAGCASGGIAAGGYLVRLEAKNAATGVVLGRAEVMHVDRPQVRAGQTVGPWTTLGYTSRFTRTSCYDVSNNAGVHVHVEFSNAHRYSCYVARGNGATLSEQTVIGRVAVHKSASRATC